MNTPHPKAQLKPYKIKADQISHRFVVKVREPIRERILHMADHLAETAGITVDEVKFHVDKTADIYLHTHKSVADIRAAVESYYAKIK